MEKVKETVILNVNDVEIEDVDCEGVTSEEGDNDVDVEIDTNEDKPKKRGLKKGAKIGRKLTLQQWKQKEIDEALTQAGDMVDTGKYTVEWKKKFLKRLEEKDCDVNRTCESMCISVRTYYWVRKKDLVFKELCELTRKKLVYTAESMLMEKVREGNLDAIKFFLRCKGKDEGWIEKEDNRIEIKTDDFQLDIK